MDWYSWLLKSPGLDRSLVYEYSLLLSQNELEEDDIAHFDNEFLLSMGIAVAKHRLEILKLAKNRRRRHHRHSPSVAALFTVIHKACDCVTRYVHDLVHHQSKAVVVVPRLAMVKKGRLMIADVVCSGVKAVQLGRSPASQSMSPMALLGSKEEDRMRWDSMFQDLKPT